MAILLTKVRPPQRRKDILRRVRLVDTIHQNLHRKLTFVSAPAGYGKTTLLVDFASDVDAIVCWYLISPGDNELVQFSKHVVAAFQQQFPEFGRELDQVLNSAGDSADPGSIAAELINEVEKHVEDFCVLILDDYHLAGENEQIIDFLENLLEHLPDQLRILIGSRSVYGIPTANLYIRDELVTISAEELRFRADELQRLVLQNYHVRLSQEQASELAKRADGWIVAIMLAIRSMENGALPKFVGATEQVYGYLAEEVVNRQTPELREFMYSTSIFDDFTEELCNFVLETKESGALLKALEERNLFVSRTESTEGLSYRYHQLFSEFLLDHFEKNDPKQLKALHSRAAEWYRKREQWETAIRHKLASGEGEEAAQWIDKLANHYYTAGRQPLISQWYRAIKEPKDYSGNAPHLLLYQAKIVGNQNKFAESEQLLDMAEPLLEKSDDIEAAANALVTRGMLRQFTGKYKEAIVLADKAQELLSGKNKKSGAKHQAYQAKRLEAICRHYLGETQNGLKVLREAIEAFRELVDESEGPSQQRYRFDLAETLNDLGLIYISSGKILEAQKAFQEALEIHLKSRGNLSALALTRNNIAYVYYQTGRYKQAWHEYALALENARASNLHRVQMAVLDGQGGVLYDLGEFDEAEEHYKQAIKISDEIGEKDATYYSLAGLAEIQRERGNHRDAMNLLRDSASLGGQELSSPFYSTRLGKIYLDMGQLELAREQFKISLSSLSPTQTPEQDQVLAALLQFQTLEKLGDATSALESLRFALKGAAQLGHDQFVVLHSQRMINELKEIHEANPSQQLEDIIKRAEKFRTGKTVIEAEEQNAEVPKIHLEVRVLGSDSVRKDGELLPASVWRSSRARALFYYIVDRGTVRKEDVGLDFWPEFSAGKISSNFHATLWRVRQALGHKDIVVFEDEEYRLHPAVSQWYDAAEFENYLEQAQEPGASELGQIELIRQALTLYKGDYLSDVFMEWADLRRDELQNRYLQALISLAELEQSNNHFNEARTLFEKVLAIDPYRDEVHMALMNCLVESGAPSAAKAHFQSYKEMLRKELNAEPLPELQAYFDALSV